MTEPGAPRFGLRGRFFVAGALLVLTTVASGGWSAFAFSRLSGAFDQTTAESDRTTAATAVVTNAIEREDDALLFWLSGDARADQDLQRERDGLGAAVSGLSARLVTAQERALCAELRGEIAAYEAAGDRLRTGPRAAGLERYHLDVNPLLRRAVASAGRIRDEHFRSTQRAAAGARDEARRATGIVSAIALVALILSGVVALYLVRLVVWPLRSLFVGVEAIRQGDFDHRVVPAGDDELGRLADGFNRMAEDVAEFRRSNLGEVLRVKETLEAVLAALPDAVLLIDAEGRVSSANGAASRILASVGAASSDRITNIALPDGARAATVAALRGEAGPPAGVDLARAFPLALGDETRRLLPRAMPVALADPAAGAVLVLYDVTDLARIDEMRVDLVAVASHELRTPLTTLRMTLLMLQETARELGPRQLALLGTALLGVEQLGSTVDEFLDLTRIEAGQLRLTLERVAVGAVVHAATARVAQRCEEAGVTLRDAVDEGLATVRADVTRLAAVLSNLLENALKYTPPGGEITVVASSMQNAGPSDSPALQIAVTDTGSGVAVEYRERIFEKFFRVEHHRGAPDQARGAGIGLYLARQIVEAHGGSIRCEAAPGGPGASIVLTIPCEAAADSTRA